MRSSTLWATTMAVFCALAGVGAPARAQELRDSVNQPGLVAVAQQSEAAQGCFAEGLAQKQVDIFRAESPDKQLAIVRTVAFETLAKVAGSAKLDAARLAASAAPTDKLSYEFGLRTELSRALIEKKAATGRLTARLAGLEKIAGEGCGNDCAVKLANPLWKDDGSAGTPQKIEQVATITTDGKVATYRELTLDGEAGTLQYASITDSVDEMLKLGEDRLSKARLSFGARPTEIVGKLAGLGLEGALSKEIMATCDKVLTGAIKETSFRSDLSKRLHERFGVKIAKSGEGDDEGDDDCGKGDGRGEGRGEGGHGGGDGRGEGGHGGGDCSRGNNGVGNGADAQPRGNPPVNDGAGTSPGAPGASARRR